MLFVSIKIRTLSQVDPKSMHNRLLLLLYIMHLLNGMHAMTRLSDSSVTKLPVSHALPSHTGLNQSIAGC